MLVKLKEKLTYTQIIVLSFAIVVLIGTALLCLPISSALGKPTPVLNSMFTATSATCVTGLVIYDTFTHWSTFGQIVIISLIQIGGLGFMTIISMFSVFLRKRIGVSERRILMQTEGSLRLSGVVTLLKRIVIGTFTIEAIGAIILSFRFCKQMGLGEGIYNAVFHSISAFCNAGFDLMGKYEQFSSFTTYDDDPLVCITIMALIVIGGIGFLVWNDIINLKTKVSKYSLHSKIVLLMTFFLIFFGTLLFLVFEDKGSFEGLPLGERILKAAFQSVTTRTAGFNTIDQNEISDSSEVLTVVLMLIGGSPGSTAGGLKTTTFAVLILSMLSAARHDSHLSVFKRRLDDDVIKQASAIFVIYMLAVLTSIMIISSLVDSDISTITFEVVSAIGTVGISRGITPFLSGASKLIIMGLMFGGRVGGLSLMLFLAEKRTNVPLDRPTEKIIIG